MRPEDGLLAATAAHAGFQAVVTVVVYPALAGTDPVAWERTHTAHGRRIAPLVGVVYLACAAACLWVLLAGPRTPATLTAVAGTTVAALVTALAAAPTHGRLGAAGPDPRLLRRLLLADRARLLAALVALGAALLAV